jgi:hypothetical protein
MGRLMAEWEYISINLNDLPRSSDEIDLLNDAGHEGWELVVITSNNIAYLKREVAARGARPHATGRQTGARTSAVSTKG